MNYTKGNWYNNGGQIETDAKSCPDNVICHVGIVNNQTRENTANANLICAAPQMYEALNEICTTELNADVIRILAPWFDKVERILSKAEGK